MALPGFGILVYKGAVTRDRNSRHLRHEFGHILQSRQIGLLKFYFAVGLWSAIRSRWSDQRHCGHPVEIWVERLAAE